MVLKGYSLLDKQSGLFAHPIWAASEGVAVRNYVLVARSKDSLLGAYPRDFDVYHIANFDDVSGVFENVAHRVVGNLASLIEASA